MMWARIVEVMLGCWLALSPFIFNHPTEKSAWWINDLTSGIALVTLALFSFWRPMRHAHLAIVLLGLWLISFAYLAAPYPTPPALQNDLMLGLLLLMFAIIPNEASLPPEKWRDFWMKKSIAKG
jgi:hypothetical protein